MAAPALAKWLKFTLDFDEPCYGPFFGLTGREARNGWLFTRSSCTSRLRPHENAQARRNVLTSKPVHMTREEWTAICSREPVAPHQLLTEARRGEAVSVGTP